MLYKNVHSDFVCNNQQLGTTQTYIQGKWIKKWWYIQTIKRKL